MLLPHSPLWLTSMWLAAHCLLLCQFVRSLCLWWLSRIRCLHNCLLLYLVYRLRYRLFCPFWSLIFLGNFCLSLRSWRHTMNRCLRCIWNWSTLSRFLNFRSSHLRGHFYMVASDKYSFGLRRFVSLIERSKLALIDKLFIFSVIWNHKSSATWQFEYFFFSICDFWLDDWFKVIPLVQVRFKTFEATW